MILSFMEAVALLVRMHGQERAKIKQLDTWSKRGIGMVIGASSPGEPGSRQA
jgi:hypothetical protein